MGREPVPDPVLVDGADAALRQARERLRGALLRPCAREPLHLSLPRPERGEIVVFETPPAARTRCGAGGTFVKRLIGLPGERLELRSEGGLSYVYINGKKLDEPYIGQNRRDARGPETFPVPAGAVLHDGRQPLPVVRLARVGDGAAEEPDREGLRHLLAAEPDLRPLTFRPGRRGRLLP